MYDQRASGSSISNPLPKVGVSQYDIVDIIFISGDIIELFDLYS
jgi:hypothetical protein